MTLDFSSSNSIRALDSLALGSVWCNAWPRRVGSLVATFTLSIRLAVRLCLLLGRALQLAIQCPHVPPPLLSRSFFCGRVCVYMRLFAWVVTLFGYSGLACVSLVPFLLLHFISSSLLLFSFDIRWILPSSLDFLWTRCYRDLPVFSLRCSSLCFSFIWFCCAFCCSVFFFFI